jgi:XTP/dITP diphosphohydrolase
MKLTLHFATHSDHKLEELSALLSDYKVIGLKELGIHEEIKETGQTLEENAKLKAEHLFQLKGGIALSEDTGLEVDALEGAPGVHTARYAGESRNPIQNMALLLRNLEDKLDRSARFVTVIAWVDQNGCRFFRGIVHGKIAHSPQGKDGFGYDPVFIPDGYVETFAQLPNTIKNKISHRARAVNALKDYLDNI